MTYFFNIIKSPLGKLRIVGSDEGLYSVYLEHRNFKKNHMTSKVKNPKHKILKQTEVELSEYFNRTRTHFTIPIILIGTDFQLKVWHELKKIPYGKTISYKELAKRIGNSNASRAVGGANNKNPLSIIIPCHRVIGSNGKLVGYAAGLDSKSKLLNL